MGRVVSNIWLSSATIIVNTIAGPAALLVDTAGNVSAVEASAPGFPAAVESPAYVCTASPTSEPSRLAEQLRARMGGGK